MEHKIGQKTLKVFTIVLVLLELVKACVIKRVCLSFFVPWKTEAGNCESFVAVNVYFGCEFNFKIPHKT